MKSVLITGSSKGLGKELAIVFGKNDYNVILHGRNINDLLTTRSEVEHSIIIEGDLVDQKTIDDLVLNAEKYDIDILINNAGRYCNKPIIETHLDEIRNIMEVNLIAPIVLSKIIFEKVFKKKQSGIIVNINSLAGKCGGFNESIYCASKHGLSGFMKALKYEALDSNVVITDVYLGAMSTGCVLHRPNFEKFIQPKEVAEQIFQVVQSYNHSSMRINEIEILRRLY